MDRISGQVGGRTAIATGLVIRGMIESRFAARKDLRFQVGDRGEVVHDVWRPIMPAQLAGERIYRWLRRGAVHDVLYYTVCR